MRETATVAAEGAKHGAPIGAIIVDRSGKIIGRGYSQVGAACDPTAHAEVVAIRDAAKTLGRPDLGGAHLYTTVAPCPMCLASSMWANVGKIHYAVSTDEADRLGFPDRVMFKDFQRRPEDRTLKTQRIGRQDIKNVLDSWFEQPRNQRSFGYLHKQKSIKDLYARGADEDSKRW